MVTIARTTALLVVGLTLTLLAGCAGSSSNKAGGKHVSPVVLTLADGENDVSNAQPFADAVKQLSSGALQIAIKSPWRATDARYETDLIKDVESGKTQMGVVASRAFDAVGIDSFQALQAPFLIDSIALERSVLGGDLARKMLAGLRPSGVVGIGILPGPLRRPFGFTRPFLSAADYQGARIGIRASGVSADVFRALGATPVVLRPDNNVSGLNGVESHLANFDSSFAERGATLTGNVVFEPRPNVLFVNRRAFASLTPSQRRVLLEAATVARMAPRIFEADAGNARDLCRRGIKIVAASDTDLARLRAAVQPVYASLESNPSTRAFIRDIESIRRTMGDSADAARCPSIGPQSRVTATASRLQGKWEVTYTRSEFLAAGADPGEDLPENYGHFVITFDRQQWSQTGPPKGGAAGTYAVDGNNISFYRHDHAYPGSDTEVWGPYTWSVFRDTLTFRKGASFVTGPSGPTELVVKPWRKIGPP